MELLPFFCAKNLVDAELVPGAPWDFIVERDANPLKALPKPKRRTALLQPKTVWNVYTAVEGLAPNLRISKTNPPQALHGLVADFDTRMDLDTVLNFLGQKPKSQHPTKIEISLGDKIRLVWIFERPVMVISSQFCSALIEKFFEKLGVPTLLPGYDAASVKPTEMWTNGGEWYDLNPMPLSWEFCFGVVCEVSKKSSLFGASEIPLEVIAEEVAKRFPSRWQGEFKLDVTGVRFWDEKADNPTGCQVKPDGMLCFTGNQAFVKWSEIFGAQWVEEQRVLNLGRAGENIYFTGKAYWEHQNNVWEETSRTDILLRLKGRGLSDKTPLGATQSDAERVLDYIQQVNRVVGAAPLVNYPPGLVEIQGRRVLNIADLRPVQPVKGPTGTPADFPWIWKFLNGLFPNPERRPLDHWLTWLKRSYNNVLNHDNYMGQAVFICGPKNNGKTLLSVRIVTPLLGGKSSNPMDYMTGETQFNDDLFEAALLAVNDEEAPTTEAKRARMLAKLKGLVVNPVHKHHAKFDKRFTIDWVGRILMTLNDDPSSVGLLLEVSANTRDKQMFFASQPYNGEFPDKRELEATIARELPYHAWWLLNGYQPPKEVLAHDRMGVKSYFDPRILLLSQQQTFASNLGELIQVWVRLDTYWENYGEWTGTPTDLLSCLQVCDATAGVAREWTQQKVAKSLTALAKQEDSGITFSGESGREFNIKPERA